MCSLFYCVEVFLDVGVATSVEIIFFPPFYPELSEKRIGHVLKMQGQLKMPGAYPGNAHVDVEIDLV